MNDFKENTNGNLKILVCVNEFFGAWNTAKGGYGFLARKLLPEALIRGGTTVHICLGRSKKLFCVESMQTEDGFKLIKLPKLRYFAAKVVNKYDVIISIEAVVDYLFSLKSRLKRPIIFWIQDPRTKIDWKEISTVTLATEQCYWNDKTYYLVNICYKLGLVKFVTQAYFLRKKAIDLYNLPKDTDIAFLPNPLPQNTELKEEKKENIIFLGRLDSVKRGWLFCEIAKRMPNYNFFVLGASTDNIEKEKNKILLKYNNVPNLHFLGHLDGEEKALQLSKAKILINTSIHEALPVSFLEAFSYGVTVISNQNPDGLVEKYGRYVGTSLGDGWDDVDKFIKEINYIMNHENERKKLAEAASEYVNTVHSFENFRNIFYKLVDECLKS